MKSVYVVEYLVRDSMGNEVAQNYLNMATATGPQLVTRYDPLKFPQVTTTNGYQSSYPNMENIGFRMMIDMVDELAAKYEFPKETPVLVGSFAIATAVRDSFTSAFESHQRRYSPTKLFMANHDLLSSLVASILRLDGLSSSLAAACSSSMFNLYMACLMIQSGETNTAIVGAVDAPLWPTFQYYWQCTGAISNTDGGICKPFDKSRDGFLQGEGGTLWFLCDEEYLLKNNLTPRAQIKSIVAGAKLATMTAHDKTGEHQSLLINRAFKQAGVTQKDISFFNAHATSTLVGDDIEFDVFKKVFDSIDIPLVSFKGQIGHTMSACGLIEASYGIEAVKNGYVHPNYGLTDPLSDDPRIIATKTAIAKKPFLKASFGFGGRTAIAIIDPL